MPTMLTVLPTDLALSRGGGERFAMSLHAALLEQLPGWRGLGLTATSDPERAPVPDSWTDATARGVLRTHPQDAVSLRAVNAALGDDVRLIIASQWQTISTAFLRIKHGRSTLVVIDYGGGSRFGSVLARAGLPVVDVSAVYSTFQQQTTPVKSHRQCLIRGGLDVGMFRPPPVEHRDLDFLLVGRFVPHKGQCEFIEAIPEGARACLIGPSGTYDPAYRDRVLAAAAKRGIHVQMDCSDAQLVSSYQRARFIVQVPVARHQLVPELLGLTLLEGMACGCVPIGPSTGPSTEFLRPGINGWAYEAGMAVDLRSIMAEAHASEELRPRLSLSAVSEAQDWTWSSAARSVLAAALSSG